MIRRQTQRYHRHPKGKSSHKSLPFNCPEVVPDDSKKLLGHRQSDQRRKKQTRFGQSHFEDGSKQKWPWHDARGGRVASSWRKPWGKACRSVGIRDGDTGDCSLTDSIGGRTTAVACGDEDSRLEFVGD